MHVIDVMDLDETVPDTQLTDYDDTPVVEDDDEGINVIPETQESVLSQSDFLSQDYFEATQSSPAPNNFIEFATRIDDQINSSPTNIPGKTNASPICIPPAKKQKLECSPKNSPNIPLNDVTPSSPTKSRPIRGRVTRKSLHEFDRRNGTGKFRVMTLTFADESGEMKVKGFEDQADRLDTLQVDEVYELKYYDVKPAFKHDKSQYEIEVKGHTTIHLPSPSAELPPPIVHNYVPTIVSITSMPKDSLIDVKGICHRIFDLTNVTSRYSGKEITKRDFTIVDPSNTEINVTLWDAEAKNFKGTQGSLISIRKGKVGEFNNKKNLSISSQTFLEVDAKIADGDKLKKWYSTIPNSFSFNFTSDAPSVGPIEWKLFDEVKGGERKFINKVYAVGWEKDKNPLYKGCPDCNKKLIELEEDKYRCEKCRKDISAFNWRLILDIKFVDATDGRFATCFNDIAESLLGKTARELADLYSDDSEGLNEFIKPTILFESFQAQFRTKMETYNNVERQKLQVDRINRIDLPSYIQELRDQLRSFNMSEF